MKTCSVCGETKPLELFTVENSRPAGLRSRCKRCSAVRAKAWYEANRGKALESRSKRKADIKTANHNYYVTHKNERNKYRQEWSEKNRESKRRSDNKYYKLHPEKAKDNAKRRRAVIKNVIVEKFTSTEIYERDKWICQVCRKRVNKRLKWPDSLSPSLDHIIPVSHGGTHERRNVQLAHLFCNISIKTGGTKQLLLIG